MGSQKLRGLQRDAPEVRVSKTLSWLLRHGAVSEGLEMRVDGYVKVDDLVRIFALSLYPTMNSSLTCNGSFSGLGIA